MEIPDEAPRLPKLPFLLGDLLLLGIAYWIASQAGSPPSTAAICGVVVCAGFGIALGVYPFLADYLREQAALVTERQNSLEALARTTSAAADQASIAANGLQHIAETVRRLADNIEDIPARLQELTDRAEQVADPAALNAAQSALQRTADRLREVDSALGRKIIELTDAVTATPLAAPAPPASKPKRKATAKASVDTETEFDLDEKPLPPAATEPAPSATPKPPPAAKPITPPPPEPAPLETAPGEADADEPLEVEEEPVDPPATTTADEPAADEPPIELADDEAESEPTPEPAPPDEEEEDEPALSSDGATRLTVTAYIGIGNRLFVRGEGPGLSWDEGTPLQFVSIGKWRWESMDVTAPVKLRLYKNDQDECTSLGELTLKPGQQREVNASF